MCKYSPQEMLKMQVEDSYSCSFMYHSMCVHINIAHKYIYIAAF